MPDNPAEWIGYLIGTLIAAAVVLAIVAGIVIGALVLAARVLIAREGWLRRRADLRVERFLAEKEATAAERPVRRIGGAS